MAQLGHEHSVSIRTPSGATYVARTFAEQQRDGSWQGWIEFSPTDGRGGPRRTDRETTQPTCEAVAYWASGLEPVYFEGAFERAHNGHNRANSATASKPRRRAGVRQGPQNRP
jgi:hypothetical protein